MNTDHQQTMLLDAIRAHGDMPIPRLTQFLEREGLEVGGDYSLYLPNRPNTILWHGLSESAARVMSAFLGRDDISPEPLTPMAAALVFSFDGVPVLNFPIAEEIHPDNDFPEPHWLPITVHRARRRIAKPVAKRRAFKRVSFTRSDRIDTWNKTHGHCWYCGKATNPFDDFTIDHVHPVADGGTNESSNLVPCCAQCNRQKNAMPLERFRQRCGGGLFWFEVAQLGTRERSGGAR